MNKYFSILGLLLATVALPGLAQTQPANNNNPEDEAKVVAPISCLDPQITNLLDITREGQLLTRDLNLALMTGELRAMDKKYVQLRKFLRECEGYASEADARKKAEKAQRYVAACDSDCHLAMGQYLLFQATDMQILSTKLESRNDPEKAQKRVQEGLEVLDRGLKVLARQLNTNSPETTAGAAAAKTGDIAKEAADSSKKPSLFNYTFKQAKLIEMKARLNMAAGDNWYITASNQRLVALSFGITNALADSGQATGNVNDNMKYANAFYKNALWLLAEAKTDIPDQQIYATLANDLTMVQRDVERRSNSAERGLLFLDLDPEETNIASFLEIKAELRELKNQLETIEGRATAMISEGYASALAQDLRDSAEDRQKQLKRESDARYQNSQMVNLSLHKIAKLEEERLIFEKEITDKIQTIEADKESANYRRQIRQLEVDLDQQKLETSYRLDALEKKKSQDMLAFRLNQKRELLNDIRWLINFEMSVSSLDIQLDAYEAQVMEYDRTLKGHESELKNLALSQQEKDQQKNQVDARLVEIENERKSVEDQRTRIYRQRRAELVTQICSLERQMKMMDNTITFDANYVPVPALGDQACSAPSTTYSIAQYNTALKNLRKSIGEADLRQQIILAKCTLFTPAQWSEWLASLPETASEKGGVTIPSVREVNQIDSQVTCDTVLDKSQQTLVMEIHDANRAYAQDQANKLQSAINDIDSWLKDVKGGYITYKRVMNGLNAAYEIGSALVTTTAAMPDTGAIAGPMGGVVTIFKPSQSAKEALAKIANVIAKIEKGYEEEAKLQDALLTAKLGLEELRGKLADMQNRVSVADLQRAMTLAKIQADEKAAQDKIKQAIYQTQLISVTADMTDQELKTRLESFKGQHAQLIARLDILASENGLMQTRIDNLKEQKSQQEAQAEIIRLEKLILTERASAINKDIEQVKTLIGNVNLRKQKTQATINSINARKEEGDAVKVEIDAMTAEQLKQTLDVSDSEAAYLKARLDKKEDAVKAETEALLSQVDRVVAQQDLRQQVRENYNKIQTAISKERQTVLDLSNQAAQDGGINPDDPSRELVMTNKEEMYSIVQGLPDFINAKRQRLEIANKLAFLVHKRRALLNNLGGTPTSKEYNYLKSARAVETFLNDGIETAINSNQIVTDVLEFKIPGNSALGQAFARDGKVSFEITPAAEGRMSELGYMGLWPNDVDELNKLASNKNVRLIGLAVAANYQCPTGTTIEANKVVVRHSGSGYVFKPLSASSSIATPVLETNAPMEWYTDVYNVNGDLSPTGSLMQYLNPWFKNSAGGVTVSSFDSTYQNRALPFLGYPIIGNYELRAAPSSCSRRVTAAKTGDVDGVDINLYFIYTYPSKGN